MTETFKTETTSLCSTMCDDQLGGLMLMAVEKSIAEELNLQMFVDTFALKQRKLNI